MVNVVMLTQNRHRLVSQALESLYGTTPEKEFTLVVCDDGSTDFRATRVLRSYLDRKNYSLLEIGNSSHVLAKLKNIAIGYSRSRFGTGDYLLICDNDCCFLPDWMPHMTEAISTSGRIILGGARHPYHQVNKEWIGWDETDAVAGTSQMMPWRVWDHLRPLRGTAAGVCQSEDFEFCQRVRAEGWRCGYMHESAILDCGITNSDGKPAPGADVKPRIEGVYYE